MREAPVLEIGPGRLAGRIVAPPSKSETHRALLLAALAGGRSAIDNPLSSADTEATRAAIAALGAAVQDSAAGLVVDGADFNRSSAEIAVDCANSGTTLRLLGGIAAARPGWTRLDGDASLRRRPLAPLLAALARAGVEVESHDGRAPVRLRGPLRRRSLVIEDPGSSQFVSALLLAAVASGGGSVEVGGKLVSAPYLEMTIAALARHGVEVVRRPLGGDRIRFDIEAGSRPRPADFCVPGDWSSAAFALCGGALAGVVRVEGLPPAATQADGAIVAALRSMGARLAGPLAAAGGGGDPTPSWIEVGSARLRPLALDLADCPDLFPVLCVTLAHAPGRSILAGAPHLRSKECDRIAVVAANLRAQGVPVRERADGLEVEGPAPLAGGRVDTAGDHRILMAFAVAAAAARAPLRFEEPDPDALAAVSYPGFLHDLARLGAAPVLR